MLTHLQLRNFAIVERLDLELGAGLTVLTGETGAGKSILIDALGLALGERAHRAQVRPGAPRAEITAAFAPGSGSGADSWLREHELDDGAGECLLRRSVANDGRSRAYINGRPVPAQMLRSLRERLVDIHGQHAHQSLLRREVQRSIVDARAGDREGMDRLDAGYHRWRSLVRDLEHETQRGGEEEGRQDFLTHQVRELEAVNPSPTEPDEVLAAHQVLSHGTELFSASTRALEALEADDAPSAMQLAGSAAKEVSRMSRFIPESADLCSLIEDALIHLQEAAGGLRRIRERIDMDPERLAQLDARLAELHSAARKHRVEPRELASLLDRMRGELESVTRREARRAELRAELDAAAKAYRRASHRVHESRDGAARELGAEMSASLRQLGMQGARFRIEVGADPERPPSPHGGDRIEFLVSANPGQPFRPVAQVASGGELSRISLAVQALASGAAGVPTLVFDEVDAGIGARVAGIVGERLRALSAARQVLCVTHLPQIASQAHHHIAVRKHATGDETTATTCHLSGERRVRELARMLAGAELTERSLAHAREMLDRSCASRPL